MANGEDLNAVLKKEIANNKTPSVQYLFFNSEKILHAFQFGYSGILDGKMVNKHSTFHAFSVTKTFTAISILQLCDQNKLELNAPAKKYLATFPYGDEITIRQLLNHTSGIPNPIPLNWIHLVNEHDSFDSKKFFQNIFQKHNSLKSLPGKKFAYSNLGYVLLGEIIEAVSGISYEDYVRENIRNKLNISDKELGFKVKEFANLATGYHKKYSLSNFILGFLINKSRFMYRTEKSWMAFEKYYINGAPYGGLVGTPNAFAVYLQSILKQHSEIISEKQKAAMFTENITANGEPTGMSLSWYTGRLHNLQYFTHAGGGGGYYCELRVYPEAGLGSVVMFNRTGMTDERFLDKPDTIALKMFKK